MKNLKILVLGSEGTLGVNLCDELDKCRSNEVFKADIMHTWKEKYTRIDISNYRQCERLIEQIEPDFVYLLAAEFGRLNGDLYYEQVWDTNCKGTQNILELQRKHDFKLIFTSSSEVYGESQSNWNKENMKVDPAHNTYAISKGAGEQLIRNYHEVYKTKTMILRLFNIYGEGEYYHPFRSVVCLFCYHALKWKPFTVYQGYHRVFQYQADAIPTLARCVRMFRAHDPINIGGTEYRSVEELADIVLDAVDASVWYRKCIEYLPEDQCNVANKRPNVEKAIKYLNHDPKTPLEIGVPRYIKWLKEVYSL